MKNSNSLENRLSLVVLLLLFIIIILLFVPCNCNAQVHTINDFSSSMLISTTKQQSELIINVPVNVQIKIEQTNGTRLTIDTKLSIEGSIKSVLIDYLISQGRYNLKSTHNNNNIVLSLNDLKPIASKSNGVIDILHEKLNYIIFVPSHITKVTINEAF